MKIVQARIMVRWRIYLTIEKEFVYARLPSFTHARRLVFAEKVLVFYLNILPLLEGLHTSRSERHIWFLGKRVRWRK